MAISFFKAIFKNGEPIGTHNRTVSKAMARMISAVNNREKIIVYGKGNQEGICSIAILILVLRYFNADFDYFLIPRRGNKETLISDIKTHSIFYNPGVILSLDESFTKNVKNSLDNVDTELITLERWQDTDFTSSKKPDPLIKSVFLFAKELSMSYNTENFHRYVDLVFLGADLKEMAHDDLINQGLHRLEVSTNYGIKALKEAGNVESEAIRAMIKPKGNPWSMVDNSRIIIELLTTEDLHRAEQIAKYLMNC